MQPATRFRILKVGGRKRAFSLEPVFWDALEEIARTKSDRLGAFIGRLLAAGPHENAASTLRSGAADWLLQEYRKLSARDYRALGQRIVDSIPIPAFVMDQGKRILAYNRAFLHLGLSEAKEKPRNAQLRLNAAFDRVVEVLSQEPQRSLALRGVLDFEGSKREGTVVVTFLERAGKQSFFLCTFRGLPHPGADG
jgi:predicted DNA-binding ribbon-helix-helix protein